MKSGNYNTTGVKSTKSITVELILEYIYNKVSDEVLSHENIFMKLDDQEESAESSYQNTLNSLLKYAHMMKKDSNFKGIFPNSKLSYQSQYMKIPKSFHSTRRVQIYYKQNTTK